MNLKCPTCKKDLNLMISTGQYNDKQLITKDILYFRPSKPRIGYEYIIDLQNNNVILGRKLGQATIFRYNNQGDMHKNCASIAIDYKYNNKRDLQLQKNISCIQVIEHQIFPGNFLRVYTNDTSKRIDVSVRTHTYSEYGIKMQYEKPYTKDIWFFSDKFIETYEAIIEKCKLVESLL